MNECECYAILNKKDPRAEIWKTIDHDLKMPLKHPLPVKAKWKDGTELMIYEGDPARLTETQRIRLCLEMSNKFGIQYKEVMTDLINGIFPICCENITVSICELHVRCMI